MENISDSIGNNIWRTVNIGLQKELKYLLYLKIGNPHFNATDNRLDSQLDIAINSQLKQELKEKYEISL